MFCVYVHETQNYAMNDKNGISVSSNSNVGVSTFQTIWFLVKYENIVQIFMHSIQILGKDRFLKILNKNIRKIPQEFSLSLIK